MTETATGPAPRTPPPPAYVGLPASGLAPQPLGGSPHSMMKPSFLPGVCRRLPRFILHPSAPPNCLSRPHLICPLAERVSCLLKILLLLSKDVDL